VACSGVQQQCCSSCTQQRPWPLALAKDNGFVLVSEFSLGIVLASSSKVVVYKKGLMHL
jgi:hypothetical protein